MTDDEIIEMSSKAGFNGLFSLIVFARMVAEREREECAKICDDRVNAYQYATDPWEREHIDEAKHLAELIRTRGQNNG